MSDCLGFRKKNSRKIVALQVRDFVNRYMPAYKAYLPVMYEKGPSTGIGVNFIIFEIDESRGLLERKIPEAEVEA